MPAPLLTFASAKASPGTTTAALLCAAVWPTDRVVVEADESGGVLAARLGLSESPGALQLAGAARVEVDRAALRTHCQESAGMPILVAPTEPMQVTATYRELAPLLTDTARAGDVSLIVDGGRLTSTSAVWPLTRAGLIVLVARTRLDEFTAFAAAARDLRSAGARVAAVLVDTGPYPPEEFASTAGVELLAVLPDDPTGAAALRGEGRTRVLGRSALWGAAPPMVDAIVSATGVTPTRPLHPQAVEHV